MGQKNSKKERERQTKWLRKLVDSKRLQNRPELGALLQELQICYVIGANQAVQLLSLQCVEKYVVDLFFENDEDANKLLTFMVERQEQQSSVENHYALQGQVLRPESSDALSVLDRGGAFLVTQRTAIKKGVFKREAKAILEQMKEIMN